MISSINLKNTFKTPKNHDASNAKNENFAFDVIIKKSGFRCFVY